MAKLTNDDIFEITYQSDVDSYPVRENFANIKASVNAAYDLVSASAIGTTNAETTNARPNHTALNDRLDSIGLGQDNVNGQINYLKTGGAVTINGGDTSKVDIAAGQAKVNGVDVNWSSSTSSAVSASAIVISNSSAIERIFSMCMSIKYLWTLPTSGAKMVSINKFFMEFGSNNPGPGIITFPA